MSQMRATVVNLRAFFAIAAVCALVFSLVLSGSGVARATSSYPGQAIEPCHSADAEPFDSGSTLPRGGHPKCPDCCLAAHANAATLPDRLANDVRPSRVAWASVAYALRSDGEPEPAPVSSVNGARAPPASSFSF